MLRVRRIWESGGTKEEFFVAIHHHHIVVKYQNIIWDATQPPLQADEVRDELVAFFNVPPSFHEWKALSGITGLTYDHMKAWSKNFKRKVYNNLIKTS